MHYLPKEAIGRSIECPQLIFLIHFVGPPKRTFSYTNNIYLSPYRSQNRLSL